MILKEEKGQVEGKKPLAMGPGGNHLGDSRHALFAFPLWKYMVPTHMPVMAQTGKRQANIHAVNTSRNKKPGVWRECCVCFLTFGDLLM